MITNERQYAITKSEAHKLEKLLLTAQEQKNVHPAIIKAQKESVQNQINDLYGQLREYEQLKAGEAKLSSVSSLSDLPILLIKARIANNLTQSELAQKLGMKEQQIQRYESEKYASASLKTLQRVAYALDLKLIGEASLSPFNGSDLEKIAKQFPIKEMYSRGWFEGFTGDVKQAVNNATDLLDGFFARAGIQFDGMVSAMHKQNIRSGGKLNYFCLQAWYARILIKAQSLENVGEFNRKNLTSEWLSDLIQLSTYPDGPSRAREYLLSAGIRLIIEPHLPETHLDGACLLLDQKYPVIALTIRHDRLDNFWFVLLHEIAHLILHVNVENGAEFFDDLDSEENGIEGEADKFALNALISEERWKKSLSRYTCAPSAIQKDAKAWSVHPAIIAGRIRKETGKWHLLNEFVGSGEVRKFFIKDIAS